jgi:hypothetical protein
VFSRRGRRLNTRSFVSDTPASVPGVAGRQYPQFFMQTDVALSESTCGGNTLPGGGGTPAGCTVPPQGPGGFYPYWSQVLRNGGCSLEFGNVSRGLGVSTFGKDAQYGTNQFDSSVTRSS